MEEAYPLINSVNYRCDRWDDDWASAYNGSGTKSQPNISYIYDVDSFLNVRTGEENCHVWRPVGGVPTYELGPGAYSVLRLYIIGSYIYVNDSYVGPASLTITDASDAYDFDSLKSCPAITTVECPYGEAIDIPLGLIEGITKLGFRASSEYLGNAPNAGETIGQEGISFAAEIVVTSPESSIETLAAKNITQTSAAIGLEYKAEDDPTHYEMGWQYKRGGNWYPLYWWAQEPFYIAWDLTAWYSWQGLQAGRTYTYRAFKKYGDDYVYGSEMSFTTNTFPVIFKPGYDYFTAKQAMDDVAKVGAGRYYADESGKIVYESRFHRIAL